MYNRARQALEGLRQDTFCASRAQDITVDGITKQMGQKIYDTLPCRLAKASSAAAVIVDASAVNDCLYTLFTAPEVRLLPGDSVVVRRQGREIAGTAGATLCYNTHNETALRVREVV